MLKRILSGKNGQALVQFIKFGLVGVSNTLISYGVEMLCFYVLFINVRFGFLSSALSAIGFSVSSDNIRIAVTSLLAFTVSIINSYFWNNRYVFSSGEKRSIKGHIKAFFKMAAAYALTGLILGPLAKMLLSSAGMPYWMASIAVLVFTIPVNFLLNKLWAFRSKRDEKLCEEERDE